MSPVASSRWCPTPEQLMILEELYRSGIRTPNASQIQRITAHLSLYGKIEGKNVFYWFQNHKARDRQKLRRKLIKQLQQQQQHHQLYHHQLLDQTEFPNHHLLGSYFDSPVVTTTTTVPIHEQITCHNPSCLLSQEGIVEGSQSSEVMNYRRKIELGGVQEKVDVENGMMKMYGHDWMMMVDHVGPPINPCCSSSSTIRPLKTLQLFPVTSTNLKQDCSDNTSIVD